jgi:hypothetical protein
MAAFRRRRIDRRDGSETPSVDDDATRFAGVEMTDDVTPDEHASEARVITLEGIQGVLGLVVTVERRWATLMLVLAVLSMISVTAKGGAIDGTIAVTPITVALIALIWLPALVNVIALAGGGLKTPAGEVSAGGLLKLIQ